MSDSNIQVGDEVSWNWGGGHPKGKVAEVKTSGKLEIESKGKRVHKNADKSNPAVHIERDGNDVVKRASELKRLRGGGDEETAAQEGGQGGDVATEESGATAGPSQEAQPAQETGEKQTTEGEKKKPARGAKKSKKATGEAGKKPAKAGAKKVGGRGRKKAAEEAAVGEKRKREEGEAKEGEDVDMEKGKKEVVTAPEQGATEREAGKEAKRAKIVHKGEHGEETAAAGHRGAMEHGSEAAAAETSRTEAVEG
ncbi:hypothetical protein F5887DRAFT_1077621 [Amanita rubescens]|nr:hypothetical protein F5887DRAFT_1077621 [Amanita rubescens]